MDWPLVIILGNMGDGKTLFATFYAKMYEQIVLENQLSYKIFANYNIVSPIFQKVKLKDLVKFPSWLRDGLLIIDEIQVEGGDAYRFLEKDSQYLTAFITQLRKRNLQLIITTQRQRFVSIRIRELVNYMLRVRKIDLGNGDFLTGVEIINMNEFIITNYMELNLTSVFPFYDTKELITLAEIEEVEEKIKSIKEGDELD